ncbi:MAG TPA: hypothetical protein DF383_13705 [Deltaproteobacteria bacterium]|nr:hypothetical protein [Deltaproteobacteria bacterium]
MIFFLQKKLIKLVLAACLLFAFGLLTHPVNLQAQQAPACSTASDPNAFCDNISGGNVSNECRAGICLGSAADPATNPSGCDYSLTPNNSNCADCTNLNFDKCGNGICEVDLGETCDTCSVDCRIPGYTDVCLAAGSAQLNNICVITVPVAAITFPGPPYPTTNQPTGAQCEDGNLCTANICVDEMCIVTPLACSINTADFCCAAGCNPPPASGTQCAANDSTCDIDCYVPEICEPTPSPTPIGCLQGSGNINGGTGNLDCSGSTCSLHPGLSENPAVAHFVLAIIGLMTLLGFGLRRRIQ